VSSAVRLLLALLAALAVALWMAGGQAALAWWGWLPCAVFAVVGHWFNRFALSPGRPPMLALAGQLVRVFLLAVVLVSVQRVLADAYLVFVRAGLGAFAVVWLGEILDLILRSRRELREQGANTVQG
jgi:hypothetical protein